MADVSSSTNKNDEEEEFEDDPKNFDLYAHRQKVDLTMPPSKPAKKAACPSANNVGPYRGTTSNVAPRFMTVRASTLDREFPSYAIQSKRKHGKELRAFKSSCALVMPRFDNKLTLWMLYFSERNFEIGILKSRAQRNVEENRKLEMKPDSLIDMLDALIYRNYPTIMWERVGEGLPKSDVLPKLTKTSKGLLKIV